MTYFRKPSATSLLFSPLPTNLSERRLRPFTKRGVLYIGTAVFLLVLLLLSVMGSPDTKDMGSMWTSNQDVDPTTSIFPLDDVVLPPIQHDDLRVQTSASSSATTSTTTSTTTTAVAKAQLPPPSHHLADEKHTEHGFPLISTNNNGKLVILTGATGRGNFFEIPNFYPNIVQNRLDYANHHGYDLMTVDLASYVITRTTHPVWGKLPAILDAFRRFPHAEWVWWLDVDAIIMTPEIELFHHLLDPAIIETKFIHGDPILVLNDSYFPVPSGLLSSVPGPGKVELIVVQDHGGINAGSFFIRNSEMMKLFVDLWSDPLIVEKTPSWLQREQQALTYLITHHPYLRERVGFVDQRLINGYVEGADEWMKGDLVVHFAGCWYQLPWCEDSNLRVDSKCIERFNRFWGRRKLLSSGV